MNATSKQLIILDKDDLTEVLESLISETVSREVEKILDQDKHDLLLTRDEVASLLDVSLPTILKWEKEGVIPKPKRLGKRVYWLRRSFVKFLESK